MVLIHSIRHLYNYQFAPSPIYSGTDQDPYESSVERKDERENLNRNPEFLILSNWRESKKEINDPERKDRFILLTNSLIHSPYLNSLFINKELGKASVSEFAYFTYSGLNELFFLCRNNQNNLGFLIWSYWFHSDGPIILKFYPHITVKVRKRFFTNSCSKKLRNSIQYNCQSS